MNSEEKDCYVQLQKVFQFEQQQSLQLILIDPKMNFRSFFLSFGILFNTISENSPKPTPPNTTTIPVIVARCRNEADQAMKRPGNHNKQ